MLHNPDKTVVLMDGARELPINGVHRTDNAPTLGILAMCGVQPDTVILSADNLVLGLTAYDIKCYEPSADWLEPAEISHGRLKKRLGYDPRDSGLLTADMDKKEKAAIGRGRGARWALMESALNTEEPSYVFMSENIHVKVGRPGFKNFTVIQDVPTLARMIEQVDDLGWDTETNGLNWETDHIVGESFSFDGKHGFYLPMRHIVEGSVYHNVNAKQVEDIIHPLLKTRALRGANLGFDVLMAAKHGLGFPRRLYDVQGYGYMLGLHVPNPKELGLKALSRSQLSDVMEEFKTVTAGADTFDMVPIDRGAPYAADDAVKSYRLIDVMGAKLAPNQLKRYEAIYMNLLYTCIRMSFNGMYLDLTQLQPLLNTLQFEADLSESHIYAYAGHKFNINAPAQVQHVLFNELKLPPTPLTASGKPSTGAEHLERISHLHPIIEEIITYKGLMKLIGTYLEGYQEHIKVDGRIHSSLNPFKVITGRLSSTNPNLMNIPVRGEKGRLVRQLFTAQGDRMLLSCDASQLEYRVLAHYTGNPALIATFNDPNRDIHTTTASIIFSKPESEITRDERDIAKTAFYAILYGASAMRIARTLNIRVSEAQVVLNKIKENIPEIDALRKMVLEKARRDGYVESYLGHRSYVYGLYSRNSGERESAERAAFDALFQGTGSGDITALATIRVQQLLDDMGYDELEPEVFLVQQIHDELLLEGPQELLEQIGPEVVRIFEETVQLHVPIVSKFGIGKRWGDIH